MSAYIVDKNHIVYLVEAARALSITRQYAFHWFHDGNSHTLDRLDDEQAADVANMLWQENIRSVSFRYPHESSGTLPGPIGGEFVVTAADFRRTWGRFNPVQVLKSIGCYRYQSCEHDQWEKSEAFAFCSALEHAAISALPGYEDLVWGAPKNQGNTISIMSLVRK